MKLQKCFSLFAIAAVAGFALAGCGKDEEPDGGNGNGGTTITPGGEGGNGGGGNGDTGALVANPAIFDFGGRRLTQVSDHYNYSQTYTYNAAGLLTSLLDSYSSHVISYTDGTITHIEDGGYQVIEHFSTNKSGYITSVTSSGQDSDDDDGYYTWQQNMTFTYDSSDRLIKAQSSCREINSSGVVSYTENSNWEMTWTNDLLTKIDYNSIDTYKGETDRSRSQSTVVYGNNYPNIYRQFTENLIETIDFDGEVEDFMYVNVLGRASSQLPIRIIKIIKDIESDGSEYTGTYTTDLSYEMNAYGLVAKESATVISDSGQTYSSSSYYYSSSGFKSPAKRMNDADKQTKDNKERKARRSSLRKARHASRR